MSEKPEPLSLAELNDLRRRIVATPVDAPPSEYQYTEDEVRKAIQSMVLDRTERHLQSQASGRKKRPKIDPNALDSLLTTASSSTEKKNLDELL